MKTKLMLPLDAPLLTYPLLAKNINSECIVLMKDAKHGTILHCDKPIHPVGQYVTWAYPVTNEAEWEVLPTGATVILTQ